MFIAYKQKQVVDGHQAVLNGDLRGVQQVVRSKRAVLARDTSGLTMLHKAALYHHTDILQHLLQTCPAAVNVTDHVSV